MLTNFFGKSKPINYIVLLVLILTYFSFSFFGVFSIENIDLDLVLKQSGLLVLLLMYCFMFGFILSKNKLTLGNSYGFLTLVSLFGFFPVIYQHADTLFFNIVMLVFFRRVVSLRTAKSFFEKLFDSGFWLAILFIIEPFSLIFSVLIYVAVSLFQKTNYQTLLIPVVGFITPLIIYFTYCFWYDILDDFYQLFDGYSSLSLDVYNSSTYGVPLMLIGVFSLLSLIIKTPKVILISGNYRKYWIIITITLLLSITYIVLKNEKNGSELLIVFFPISIMITNWIESIERKILKEIVLLLFLLGPTILFIV
ncbi:DUF6427 family protein [Flavobacteriaceae bacterium S356]|uniref:DUF6427 family protein n=1 Tax=Asprobacillus argus TaxID=3076534 RepID=A0ABU3LBT0_9FLAO|nr:DUF6427 family protein [Flavobacteriaceae bacterium S356]